MSTPLITIPGIGIDPITTGISWLATGLSPLQDLFTYLCPRVRMLFTSAFELQRGANPTLEGLAPQKEREALLNGFDELTDATKLSGRVSFYTSTGDSFYSEGGVCKAILHIPLRYVRSTGTESRDWTLTEPEKKFLVLRELGYIKFSDQAIKLAARVALIVALVFLYIHPVGWAISAVIFAGIFVGAMAVHYRTKKDEQLRLDEFALTHLQQLSGGDRASAMRVAKSALEKLQAQNLYRRENSRFGSFMMTEAGDPRFVFEISLSERIKRLDQELGSNPQMLLSVT